MKILILSLLFAGCAHRSPQDQDLVSVDTALMQAQASYLKGCVDGLKKLGVPLPFHGCRDMSVLHRRELDEFMDQDIIVPQE